MQKMTMEALRYAYIRPNDLVKVFEGMKLIYFGPAFVLPKGCNDLMVEDLRPEIETRRRDWQTAGTWAPLAPETLPLLEFKDMEQRLYWRITLERRSHEQTGRAEGIGKT